MTPSLENTMQPGINYHFRMPDAQSPFAQAKNICVIMFTTHQCGKNICAQSRANTMNFVGGNRNAYACTTNKNTAFRFSCRNCPAYLFGNIGIVDRGLGKGTEIEDFNIPRLQIFLDMLLQMESAMITANRDSQAYFTPNIIIYRTNHNAILSQKIRPRTTL